MKTNTKITFKELLAKNNLTKEDVDFIGVDIRVGYLTGANLRLTNITKIKLDKKQAEEITKRLKNWEFYE